jgi:hypothetical protein
MGDFKKASSCRWPVFLTFREDTALGSGSISRSHGIMRYSALKIANERIVLPNGIGLQMGHQAPNSSIPLKPGERATIRAKTRLVLGNAVPGQRVALRAIYIPFTATVSIASSGEVYGDSSSGEGLISQNDVVVCYGECR